jgi:hypothetical protein
MHPLRNPRAPPKPGRSFSRKSARSKFSEQDLSALKTKDDVVAAVVAKYGLEKAQAQRDVEFLMKGRHI